jgi:tetratricopeptide (TPR) repeat protein/cold shock CspA family protein
MTTSSTQPPQQDHLGLAIVAAERLEWSEAADILSNAGTGSEVLKKKAFYLSRAKRYSEALEALAELLKRKPDDFMALYMTGYQYYEQKGYAEAITWFDRALEGNPDHIKVNWRRAYALSATGQAPAALEAAARVLRLYFALPSHDRDPQRQTFAKASHMLGKAELDKGRAHEAVAFLEQAVLADASDPFHLYLLGKAHRLVGSPDLAITELRRARALKPGDLSIELELAASLLATGDKEGCVAGIARIEARCRGWQAFKAGRLVHEAERPELAIRLLERAARERDTRGEPSVMEALAAARASHTARDAQSDATSDEKDVAFGAVDVVRADKGFGFLVDESGTRRHFRLRDDSIHRGDRVRFTPAVAPKGPVAKDVVRV